MAMMKRALGLMLATAITSNPILATMAAAQSATPMVTAQPNPGPAIIPFFNDPAKSPKVAREQLIRELRQKVKYVFVVFNENHSFDNEYGTFPGANGLYADAKGPRDAAHTPGLVQSYKELAGQSHEVTAFRMGPSENASFRDSVDHSHTGLAKKLHVVNGTPQMDQFAQADYDRVAKPGNAASDKAGQQFANLVMSHIDCDTIPFFWNYASRFTLFDNIFATEDTPSTPNAIAMIAGQAGETQWVKHGTDAVHVEAGTHKANLQLAPFVNDPQPIWGSQFDPNTPKKMPDSPSESYADANIAENATFASLPLTFAGRDLAKMVKQDTMAETDLADVKKDIPFITGRGGKPVNWRWYQEGFDHEAYEAAGVASHVGYVSHHQGPQYFGYVANNPAFAGNMRGMSDFMDDMKGNKLPSDGGVFYIRGGFSNVEKMQPPIQNANFPGALTEADIAAINKTKHGDDDHPGYTDGMISEAMAAHVVNAVAGNPKLWAQSAIIITYDESDGFYDHVAPQILSYGPDGLPLARGVRIPLILISPYARVHAVSHAEGDHNAVIETLNAIYDLPALSSLPEEKAALISGQDPKFNGPNGFKQSYLGPRDTNSPATDDLLSGFDPDRLSGKKPMLPASYAMIDEAVVSHLPHYDGKGCQAIGMTPTDAAMTRKLPEHFNSLPATLPAYN